MGNQWKVKKCDCGCGEWEIWGPDRSFDGGFTTHAGALAYADRQARTITVELPRYRYHPGEPIKIEGIGGARITVPDGRVEPISLQLLSMHHQKLALAKGQQ